MASASRVVLVELRLVTITVRKATVRDCPGARAMGWSAEVQRDPKAEMGHGTPTTCE